MEEKQAYQVEYENFIRNYKQGTDGETIGITISRLAQFYANKNLIVAQHKIALSKVAVKEIDKPDDQTGKPMSVAKAELFIKGSPEAEALGMEEAHLKNIEQFINALKYLQKGLLNEYAHMRGN